MTGTNGTAQSIIDDAQWLPHSFDSAEGRIRFAKLSRDIIVREPFLDERVEPHALNWADVSVSDILSAKIPEAPKPAFIFHTAFCCSTLLARALDCPGRVLSYKEPHILMGLSNAYRLAKNDSQLRELDTLTDRIFALLARPMEGAERVVCKPTNTANNLAPIAARKRNPTLLLYGDLRGFLASVLKKGEPCKAFVRKQYLIFALEKLGVGAIPQRDALGLTDLQIAALVWRHQMESFSAIAREDNVCSLAFRKLLSDPRQTLQSVNERLALGLDNEQLSAAADGPIFKTNSKSEDQSYDAAARAKDEDALMAQYGDVISMIDQWTLNLSLGSKLLLPLPNAVR